MACLIGFIDSHERSVREKLEEAYRAIAEAYFACLHPSPPVCLALADFVKAVNEHAAVVNLRPARAKCEFVCDGEMDAGEVRDQLRQVEVLFGACELLTRIGLSPSESCPTQGSADQMGKRVEDLQVLGFVLDGFGGDDIKNNHKAAKMLNTLAVVKTAKPFIRTFVAMRRLALVRNTSEYPGWQYGGHVREQYKREWTAEADVVLREENDHYALIEVNHITITRRTAGAE